MVGWLEGLKWHHSHTLRPVLVADVVVICDYWPEASVLFCVGFFVSGLSHNVVGSSKEHSRKIRPSVKVLKDPAGILLFMTHWPKLLSWLRAELTDYTGAWIMGVGSLGTTRATVYYRLYGWYSICLRNISFPLRLTSWTFKLSLWILA